ncbi:MAG: hypothetical protein AABW50_05490 [Nanoarchaeota archaeon]
MKKIHIFPNKEGFEKAIYRVAKKWDGLVANPVNATHSVPAKEIGSFMHKGRTLDIDLEVEDYSGDYIGYLTNDKYYDNKKGSVQNKILIYTLERNFNFNVPETRIDISELGERLRYKVSKEDIRNRSLGVIKLVKTKK